jgi:hypothetical protein
MLQKWKADLIISFKALRLSLWGGKFSGCVGYFMSPILDFIYSELDDNSLPSFDAWHNFPSCSKVLLCCWKPLFTGVPTRNVGWIYYTRQTTGLITSRTVFWIPDKKCSIIQLSQLLYSYICLVPTTMKCNKPHTYHIELKLFWYFASSPLLFYAYFTHT